MKAFEKHNKILHQEIDQICHDCDKIFHTRMKFYIHRRIHGRIFSKCKTCGESFKLGLITAHIKKAHIEETPDKTEETPDKSNVESHTL